MPDVDPRWKSGPRPPAKRRPLPRAYRAGAHHKCDQHRLGESHSAASDVRVGWPACVRFEKDAD